MPKICEQCPGAVALSEEGLTRCLCVRVVSLLHGAVCSFEAVADEAVAGFAETAGAIVNVLSAASNAPVLIKIKSEPLVVVVGQERVDLEDKFFGQEPRRKEGEVGFLRHGVSHRLQLSG